MKLSVVVNTCCLGEGAETISASGQTRGGLRDWTLRNFILPFYDECPAIDEVVVVGEYEDGPNYTYVPCPSEYFSTADCLKQRQLGFEATDADFYVFQHDDHILGFEFDRRWRQIDKDFDILIPARFTRARERVGERINNGEASMNPHVGAYIGGHICIQRAEAVEELPWTYIAHGQAVEGNSPPWDVIHTVVALNRGLTIVRNKSIRAFDIEHGATPWA